jgi:hypothetical protein
MPSWLVLLLVAGGLGAALFGFYRLMGGGDSGAAAKKGGLEQPGPIGSSSKHPYARHLEVTGLRLSEDGGRIKIQYVIVNHSAGELSDLALKVALLPKGSKPEDPPLAVLDVKVGALAPYEARDMSAHAKMKIRSYEMPDWQFLRADFEITSPPQ